MGVNDIGWAIRGLKLGQKVRLRSKDKRTAAEQKRLKRVNFALHAKNGFGKAK